MFRPHLFDRHLKRTLWPGTCMQNKMKKKQTYPVQSMTRTRCNHATLHHVTSVHFRGLTHHTTYITTRQCTRQRGLTHHTTYTHNPLTSLHSTNSAALPHNEHSRSNYTSPHPPHVQCPRKSAHPSHIFSTWAKFNIKSTLLLTTVNGNSSRVK